MTVLRSLRRLHGIRKAEERQRGAQMELSLVNLRFLHVALEKASQKVKDARSLIAASVNTGDQVDRIAALQELAAAEHAIRVLPERITAAETEVALTAKNS